ncbi:hypothetical protein DPMN_174360 [Dreissena polymorpha]|uniref:Uncharacterized protein n=1 Tax=Dreissena polymorpha TaxID=45954 RepID=A0A9D4E7B1_DREPO|nr:hypothetical protein DPMN_174360 [Dreissena polymorpha]
MPWIKGHSDAEDSGGSWGNSGWTSSAHSGGHGSRFGSSSWGACDRPEDPCPLGTHLDKCINCNKTRWSNRGLMQSHYDENCPGCRRERSFRSNGMDQFGGYLSADFATGVMLLGTLYANAQKEESEETQPKTLGFLGSAKRLKNRLAPLVASRSLWDDTYCKSPLPSPSSSAIEEEAQVVDGNADLSLTKMSNGDKITLLPASNGKISTIKVKGFKSLWSVIAPKKLATRSLFRSREVQPRMCTHISLWGPRDNLPKLCATKSLFK